MTIIASIKREGSSFPTGIAVEERGPSSFPSYAIIGVPEDETIEVQLALLSILWNGGGEDRALIAEALRMTADYLDDSDE